jgi:hypothetical protein
MNTDKEATEKNPKKKEKLEKKTQQNELQSILTDSNKQPKQQANNSQASKDSSKKTVKQENANSSPQVSNDSIKVKIASTNINNAPSTISSQSNNKEFSQAPDVIQLKKFKGFKLFNHLQYICDYSSIYKLPYV